MSQSVLLKASRDESRDADALKITTVDSLPDTREEDPPPNETKFIESPTPGLSPPHSPVEKMTPSNQFNLLAAEGLDKAVAAPKVAAMHKRFNSSLNQYLEAPI